MRIDRRAFARVLAVVYAFLALNAWSQPVLTMLGRSNDPPSLIAFQLGIGLTGAITAWGGWRGARWTPIAALGSGLLTATMLASLASAE